MATINPGRYTVLVTVTVFADSRHDAYRQIKHALSRKADGVTFEDADDTQIEPFCANTDAHDCYEARDLAVEGSTLCAACLAAEVAARVAAHYPPDWPKCHCGLPVMDGHLTCGKLECDEAGARAARDAAFRAKVPGRDAS